MSRLLIVHAEFSNMESKRDFLSSHIIIWHVIRHSHLFVPLTQNVVAEKNFFLFGCRLLYCLLSTFHISSIQVFKRKLFVHSFFDSLCYMFARASLKFNVKLSRQMHSNALSSHIFRGQFMKPTPFLSRNNAAFQAQPCQICLFYL